MMYFAITFFAIVVCSSSQLQTDSGCTSLRNAYQAFCPRQLEGITTVTVQGRPGKRGANGLKGDRGSPGEDGERGPPGVTNYDQIEEIIQRRIQKALAIIEGQVTRLEDTQGLCPVKYGSKCFWMELRYEGITCLEGQTICESLGGHPANVYSEEHYLMLKRYMATLIRPSTGDWLQAHLGLKYNTKTSTVTLSNGTAAPYLKWHPGYPTSGNRPCMGFETEVLLTGGTQNIFHELVTDKRRGVMCEK